MVIPKNSDDYVELTEDSLTNYVEGISDRKTYTVYPVFVCVWGGGVACHRICDNEENKEQFFASVIICSLKSFLIKIIRNIISAFSKICDV